MLCRSIPSSSISACFGSNPSSISGNMGTSSRGGILEGEVVVLDFLGSSGLGLEDFLLLGLLEARNYSIIGLESKGIFLRASKLFLRSGFLVEL